MKAGQKQNEIAIKEDERTEERCQKKTNLNIS